MSKENVEIVRDAIDRFNRTGQWDFRDVGAHFEMDLSRSMGPQRGVFFSVEQAERSINVFASDWESIALSLMSSSSWGMTWLFRGRLIS